MTGNVSARVGQTCVVTLEPVESEYRRTGRPAGFTPQADSAGVGKIGDTDYAAHTSDEDPPEPLVGGKVDLGGVATDFLLGIDPYPRKEEQNSRRPKMEEGPQAPVAALEALKKRPGDGWRAADGGRNAENGRNVLSAAAERLWSRPAILRAAHFLLSL